MAVSNKNKLSFNLEVGMSGVVYEQRITGAVYSFVAFHNNGFLVTRPRNVHFATM